MNTTQILNISDPVSGMLIYNTQDRVFMIFNGTRWTTLVNLSLGVTSNGTITSAGEGLYTGADMKYPFALLDVSSPNKTLSIKSSFAKNMNDASESLLIFDIELESLLLRTSNGWYRLITN